MTKKDYTNKEIYDKLVDHDKKSSFAVIVGIAFSIVGFSYALIGIGSNLKDLEIIIYGVLLLFFSFAFFVVGVILLNRKFKN